jgi:hypothetical protein
MTIGYGSHVSQQAAIRHHITQCRKYENADNYYIDGVMSLSGTRYNSIESSKDGSEMQCVTTVHSSMESSIDGSKMQASLLHTVARTTHYLE